MAVADDPFLAPRGNTNLILSAVRQQLFHHRGAGRQNVVAFEEAFKAWDSDGDRRLSHFEFEKALGRCGIFLPSQDINALFRLFDTQGDGHADAEEVLVALRVPLNERRLAVVDTAFSSLVQAFAGASGHGNIDAGHTDRSRATEGRREDNGDGGHENASTRVPLDLALERLKPEGHPEVSAGRLAPNEVRRDFEEFFSSSDDKGSSAGTPGFITLKGFREYYRDVGVCEPYDTVFVPMMEGLWDVKEPRPGVDRKCEITRLLRPKLLQHSHHAETTAEVFKKTLRFYSLADDCVDGGEKHHGGKVDAAGLESALTVFGVYPDKQDIAGIFEAIGSPTGGGPEQINKVVAFLCPPEPEMAPMF